MSYASRISRFTAIAAIATLALTGCSASNSGSGGAGGSGSAPDCVRSSDTVNLTFTSWVPNIDKVVALWNEKHPKIHVKVQTGPSGNAGTYNNFFNELKAGNAPDLGQVEYDALPNFRVQDGLMNIAKCGGVSAAKSEFIDWTWSQVTFGEKNAVYAIPQDTGPMAMFYRADLFKKAGIPIPTTWDEYAADAKKIHDQGGYITNFSTADVNQFAGFVWQTGGQWFNTTNNTWDVNLTGSESTMVAKYWGNLVSNGLVSTYPGFTDEWNNAYNTSKVWTWVSAVWGANSLISGAPATAGDWRVAPMPQWKAGDHSAGDWGGSSTVVFKGSKHPYEAAQFALWLNTSPEAQAALNQQANLYPATTAGLKLPVLQKGVPFYGGQTIYDVFAKASQNVKPDFVWGPTMSQTYKDVADGFGAAVSGNGTLLDALKVGQQKTVAALKAKSIPVKG